MQRRKDMSFLYLFDVLDFDKNGHVCGSKSFDENHAKANFLYLLSKYNQSFLKDEKMAVPDFFKKDLNDVLSDVEKGGDFSKAEKKVLENCLKSVQSVAKSVKNEKDLIAKLNEKVVVKDKEFASDFKNLENNKHLEYVLTFISGQIFERASLATGKDFENDKKAKSNLFKDIIRYNSLVNTADKVKDNKLSFEEVQKIVG